jgi:hypothetical protein
MCVLHGYWQSEMYFASIEPLIRREFTLREEPSARTQRVASEICGANSVFVHFRRCDAVHEPRGASIHGTPPAEYYAHAAAYVNGRVSNPHFFVFSDEAEWVKQNVHLPGRMTVVDHNLPGNGDAPGREHEDLWLMSLCRHAIIANSSFSWWGAWLNPDRERIVIAPKLWFRSTHDARDLVPQRWLRM